jgi:orotidine-5'-phosphate decarboxylase
MSEQKVVKGHATGTDTVTVACNLPNGLILQLYDVEKVQQTLPSGKVFEENVSTLRPDLGRWALNGVVNRSALAATGREDRLPEDYRLIPGIAPDTGFALTPGIPRDFWERWLEDNKGSPLVTGRHVFAAPSEARAVGQAKEFKEVKSGFQGLNQGGDYRVPNGRAVRKFDRMDNEAAPETPEAQ